jgi:hypothetical protein
VIAYLTEPNECPDSPRAADCSISMHPKRPGPAECHRRQHCGPMWLLPRWPRFRGVEFTPLATFQLTDVPAFVGNFSNSSSVVDFYIYSSGAGVPVTDLIALTGTIAAGLPRSKRAGRFRCPEFASYPK